MRLIEATPGIFSAIDCHARLVAVSDTWLHKMGCRRDTVLGRPAQEFFAPWSNEHVRRSLLGVIDGLAPCEQQPFQMLTQDGRCIDVLVSTAVEHGPDGHPSGVLVMAEDITAQRSAERALAAQRERLALLINSTRAGTWEWNLQTGEVIVNERWAEILGHTLQAIQPRHIDAVRQFYHPDDAALSASTLQAHVLRHTPLYDLEVRMRHREGHWVWVHSRGRVMSRGQKGEPLWMFGTDHDVSERVAQRLALQEVNARFALASQSGGIGIWDWDLASDELTWDARTYALFGLDPNHSPVTPQRWRECVHPQDRAVMDAALLKTTRTIGRCEHELRVRWADGSLHHLRCAAQASTNAQGQVVRLTGVTTDVTHERHLALELAQQLELMRVTLRSIADAVITTDQHGRVLWLNPVAERLTGWHSDEAYEQRLERVFCVLREDTREPAANPLAACFASTPGPLMHRALVLTSRDGQEYGIEESASPICNDDGQILGAVLVFRDVTESRRLAVEMRHRASHDELTSLKNRREFDTRLQRILDTAHDDGSTHALLYIDLDQFKLVNDACGHAAGDLLLQQVSRLLQESVRGRDTLARLGGDEFGALLEHCSVDGADKVAQQICERMEDFRFVFDGRRFRIGASIGLVPVDRRWSSAAAILQAADTACYAAKEAGRNRIHTWFDSDVAMAVRHGEMRWANRIELALDENRFELYAQRIESLQPGQQRTAAEVLLRMIDTEGSTILPGAFLPAAERFHLATRIDRWVLRRVLSWVQGYASLDSLRYLSVNLSGQSIADRAFHHFAIQQLRAAGPRVCERLCLEITETAAVTKLADAALFIDDVRALGVRVALDDFGSGASSFGYLKTLKVDILKIDGQFITGMINNPLDEVAVRCFADVARTVGVQTVAEFVSDPAVVTRLQTIGIDSVQGYLVHKPQALEEALRTAPRTPLALAA